MKWILTEDLINLNNVTKITFDTHWSPEGIEGIIEGTPVLCVDMYVNVDGESHPQQYIYNCSSYNKFNVRKLEDKFVDFIDSNLVHVFDFYQKCRDVEADEYLHNR